MYTLYYLNRNLQIGTLKVSTLDAPILIPEDLVFCNFRKDAVFIKYPHMCIDFNDTERLLIASEFSDIELLKDFDFRRANTYLNAACAIDEYNGAEKQEVICKCGCDDDGELRITFDDLSESKTGQEGDVIVLLPVTPEGTQIAVFNEVTWTLYDVHGLESISINLGITTYGPYGFTLVPNNADALTQKISNVITYQYQFPVYGTQAEIGNRVCSNGKVALDSIGSHAFFTRAPFEELMVGDNVFNGDNMDNPFPNNFCSVFVAGHYIYFNIVDGLITEVIAEGTDCSRYLQQIQISGTYPNTADLSYLKSDGTPETDVHHFGGTGEEVYYTFNVGYCVSEPSVNVTGANWENRIWQDNVNCPI